MATNSSSLRPKPRFAGATEFVLIGVESVVKGLSEGEVGLVAGGVLLVLLGAAAGFVGWWWSRRRRAPTTTPRPPQPLEETEMETFSQLHPFAPTPLGPTRV
jgi:hypothetical protein